MDGREEKMGPHYQLRYAAGTYWLLDMWQTGVPFLKPLAVNEAGACIFKLSQEGKSRAEIAAVLSKKYQADEDEVKRDVVQFLNRLQECGISIQGGSDVK